MILATVLVFFMQAGFAFLEIGFSRGKNAGMGIAKILVNFSIATIAWWGIGFAVAFGGAGWLAGDSGFFATFGNGVGGLAGDLYGENFAGGTAAFFIFQFMFCAVSLAIVWGTTLERMKFMAYIPFALVFAGDHLPAHRPLGLRRRPVRRDRLGRAGLRGLLGRAPHRRHRGAGGADLPRAAQGQVRP